MDTKHMKIEEYYGDIENKEAVPEVVVDILKTT